MPLFRSRSKSREKTTKTLEQSETKFNGLSEDPSQPPMSTHAPDEHPNQRLHLTTGVSRPRAIDKHHKQVSSGVQTQGRHDNDQANFDRRSEIGPEDVVSTGMLKDDVKALFYGAPHFMLEKGKHGKAFPQAFFPWNNDLEVSDLTDRCRLKHESFGLSTLHAHLPVPNSAISKTGSACHLPYTEPHRRPMFDLGIFELPNMLSVGGKEAGTVGMQYFLEMPLAEEVAKKAQECEEQLRNRTEHLITPAEEATKTLTIGASSALVGKHAPPQDRLKLARACHEGWRHVGVRDISVSSLIERLSFLSDLHEQVLQEGFHVSLLDKQPVHALYGQLFDDFLYPPEATDGAELSQSLKVQIEVLTKVLTTPGAWIDFSIDEWRLRFGQVLWELQPPCVGDTEGADMLSGCEKMWLLIQVLLATELLLRLDAALRLGVAKHSIDISSQDIHHFNKHRNDKVNWDLVLARRFLDAVKVSKANLFLSESHEWSSQGQNVETNTQHEGRLGSPEKRKRTSLWSVPILPRQLKTQVEALYCFAKEIEWPMADAIERHCQNILQSSERATVEFFVQPISRTARCDAQQSIEDATLDHKEETRCRTEAGFLALQPSTDHTTGGWLSRSWFMGMALPGESASGLLIATLIENDCQSYGRLGGTVLLKGGFVLGANSWWSISNVLGRVFACLAGKQCMGWIFTPELCLLRVGNTPVEEGWYNIQCEPIRSVREGMRIHDGDKLAAESSVLGTGRGKVQSTEFRLVDDRILGHAQPAQVELEKVTMGDAAHSIGGSKTIEASATFRLYRNQHLAPVKKILRLAHDAYFVTAHSCQRPYGHAHFKDMTGLSLQDQQGSERLPAHPLHQSYRYQVKSVADLPDADHASLVADEDSAWIIDATGQPAKDAFARAWCAHIGKHALVARVGKTCLSCCIREAKALQVNIVIRVGSSLVPIQYLP